jgi:alkylhydroperoxidase/carboxymuconolactone decarboxylase family protein YurZ
MSDGNETEAWGIAYPKYPWNQIWESYDPEKLALYQQWTNQMLSHKELPPKVREFIFVAVDSIVAWPSPYIDGHIHEAFDTGATIQELVEVIEVSGYLMGVHALNHGLTSLEKVILERREAGRIVPRDAAEAAAE